MTLAADVTAEDIEVFLQEAEEQLVLLDEDIVQLERDPGSPDLLQEIFRAAHTLKGSSAMLGYAQMAEVAHSLENLLDKIRKGTVETTTQVVDALLHSLDVLVKLKDELVNSNMAEVDISGPLAELERAAAEGDGEEPASDRLGGPPTIILEPETYNKLNSLSNAGEHLYEVGVTFREETSWTAVRAYQVIEALSKLGEVIVSSPTEEDIQQEKVGLAVTLVMTTKEAVDTIREVATVVEDVAEVTVDTYFVDPPVESPKTEVASAANGTQKALQRSQTLRIDVERLDAMMNMVGELVIDRTRILQISRSLESRFADDDMVQALSKTAAHIVRVVDELQESTLKVRMLPIGTVFSGFPRMIRDLAQNAGKKLEFVVDGQDTEIDRTVVEMIRDPLVHILRNAVDHGLEIPQERKAANKLETATVRLSAYHAGGHIVIEVQDDGRGIDPNRVKESALKKGVITEEVANRLTDSEAIDLIFMPGMSTASETTEVSGRGVGMDIVKTNIESINGFVTLDTVVGKGTKFTLKLPLTLATVEALLVTLRGTLYAVPVVHVIEAAKMEVDDIQTIRGREVFRLRGEVVPLVRLSTALGITDQTNERDKKTYVVVVRLGERLIGLGVEELIELQEIVVKSIGEYTGNSKGVSGASIMGDGQVALILDVPTLINMTALDSAELIPIRSDGVI